MSEDRMLSNDFYMIPTETLNKWIEEAELRIKSYKDVNAKEDQERTGIYLHALAVFTEPENRIIILAKALQSALEVLKEKDEALEFYTDNWRKIRNEPRAFNESMAKKALALKPHLEGLERLERLE